VDDHRHRHLRRLSHRAARPRRFGHHSIATATAARWPAPRAGARADEAFTAGLLPDIGKLIFAIQADAGYQRVLEFEQETGTTALLAERALLEFTHPAVDEAVAERWSLPGCDDAAIAHHHDPGAAGDEARFWAMIGLADQAAHALSAAGTPAPAREPQKAARLADLGLGPADRGDCLQHLHEAGPEIEGLARALR
jgi:HD-like signal output (HDOD) protein